MSETKIMFLGLKPYLAILKNRNLFIILIAEETRLFIGAFLTWFLPILTYEIGGAILLATLYTIQYSMPFLVLIISSVLADVLGRKAILLAGRCITWLASVLILVAYVFKNPIALLGVYVLISLFTQAIDNIIGVIVMESLPKEVLGRAASMFTVITMIVASSGSILYGWLMTWVDVLYLLIMMVVVRLFLLPLYLMIEETGRRMERRFKRTVDEVIDRFKSILRPSTYSFPIALYIVYTIPGALTSGIVCPYFWPFFREVCGLTPLLLSIASTCADLATAIGNLIGGILVDKYGPLRTLMIYNIIVSPALVAFSLAPNPIPIVAYSISSGSSGLSNVASFKYVRLITRDEDRAMILGVLTTIGYLSRVPGPLIGAYLWNISPILPFLISATDVFIRLPLLIYMKAKLKL